MGPPDRGFLRTLTLSRNAGPKPRYPFRPIERTEPTTLENGPTPPLHGINAVLIRIIARFLRAVFHGKRYVLHARTTPSWADVVDRMTARGIRWFATATTVAEALQAEAAGAGAIIAQGSEAGGHRGAFYADRPSAQMCGLMALVPAVCEVVTVPVIATGRVASWPRLPLTHRQCKSGQPFCAGPKS